MNGGTAIGFRFPEYLAGHARHIALAQEDKAGQKLKGIPLSPSEINVGFLARKIAEIEENCGDRIGNRRRLGPENPKFLLGDRRSPQSYGEVFHNARTESLA
jgi:hypothetical protein